MKLFKQEEKNTHRPLIIGIGAGILVVAGIITKLYMMVKKFKRNADFFFLLNDEDLDFSGEVFEDTSVAAIKSNVTIDLSDALSAQNPMNLFIKGMSAGVDVIVPEDWNVKVQGENQSSFIDNLTTFDREDFDSPLLFINYRLNRSDLGVYTPYSYGENDSQVYIDYDAPHAQAIGTQDPSLEQALASDDQETLTNPSV